MKLKALAASPAIFLFASSLAQPAQAQLGGTLQELEEGPLVAILQGSQFDADVQERVATYTLGRPIPLVKLTAYPDRKTGLIARHIVTCKYIAGVPDSSNMVAKVANSFILSVSVLDGVYELVAKDAQAFLEDIKPKSLTRTYRNHIRVVYTIKRDGPLYEISLDASIPNLTAFIAARQKMLAAAKLEQARQAKLEQQEEARLRADEERRRAEEEKRRVLRLAQEAQARAAAEEERRAEEARQEEEERQAEVARKAIEEQKRKADEQARSAWERKQAEAQEALRRRPTLGLSLEAHTTPTGTGYGFFNLRSHPFRTPLLSPMLSVGGYPRALFQNSASSGMTFESGSAYKGELYLWFPGERSQLQVAPFARGAYIDSPALRKVLFSGGLSVRYGLFDSAAGPAIYLNWPIVASPEDPLRQLSLGLTMDFSL